MEDKELFLEIEQRLLDDDKPSVYLEEILKDQRLDNYPFSMIKELEEVEQNPKFHPEGNVFIHTMMVIDQGAKVRDKSRNKRVFMWALLLHDIGKKPTTKIRKGKLTSYNHDIVGADMSRKFLKFFGEDENFIEEVSSLVRWHMQSLFVTKNLKYQNVDAMLDEVNINDIVLVSLSDRLGRGKLKSNEIRETEKQINVFKECISKALRKRKS